MPMSSDDPRRDPRLKWFFQTPEAKMRMNVMREFGLDLPTAKRWLDAMKRLPHHPLDMSLTFCCRNEGDAFRDIEQAANATDDKEVHKASIAKVAQVTLRAVRALGAAGAERDFEFVKPEDAEAFLLMQETRAPDDSERIAAVRAAICQGSAQVIKDRLPLEDNRQLDVCYTVGLTVNRLPELIAFQVPASHSESFLSNIASRIRAEGVPEAGARMSGVLPGLDVAFLKVAPAQAAERMPVARETLGGFTALQVVIPDAAGRFPWEPGCDADTVAGQPLLGLIH